MATYTKSTNTDPTKAIYGEYSPAVIQLQAQLNRQNMGKPGYTPIMTDGKFGPLTQAAMNFKPAGGAIPIDGLGNKPTPIVTPPPYVPNAAAGLAGFIDATTGQFKTPDKLDQKEINNEAVSYANLMKDLGNIGVITEDIYKEQGVDTAKDLYEEAVDKRATTALANRRQQEAMLGSGGATLEQLSPQIQGLQRRAAAQDADMAISENVLGRRYDRALAIADRKIEMEMEPKKAKLEGMKFLLEHNLDQFTKEDELRLKKEFAKFESELQLKNYRAKAAIDAAASASGDTNYVPQAPTTYTVKSTDANLAQIAQDAGVDVEELKALNSNLFQPSSPGIIPHYSLKTGDVIKLPVRYTPPPILNAPKSGKPPTIAAQKTGIQKFLVTGITPGGQKLGNPRGADGYVDPGIYIEAFKQWTGTAKDFVNYFPISSYVNPASYNLLPEAIRPKAAATSSRER